MNQIIVCTREASSSKDCFLSEGLILRRDVSVYLDAASSTPTVTSSVLVSVTVTVTVTPTFSFLLRRQSRLKLLHCFSLQKIILHSFMQNVFWTLKSALVLRNFVLTVFVMIEKWTFLSTSNQLLMRLHQHWSRKKSQFVLRVHNCSHKKPKQPSFLRGTIIAT